MHDDPYAFHARFYDRLYEPAAALLRSECLRLAPPREGQAVLDIGCGTGTQLALYRRPGCRLAGVDTSAAMLAVARRKLGDSAELYRESGSRMRFADASFDLVSIVLALHEMPEALRHAVLQEALRVLRPGGRLLIIDYHFGPHDFPRGWFWKAVVVMMEMSAGREHFRNYRQFIGSRGIEGLAARLRAAVVQRHVVPSGVAAVYLLGSCRA